MTGALTLRFASQAQQDIGRISDQLADLHRQVGSGARAVDLVGFGARSSQLLSARALRAAVDTRASVLSQLDTRLDVQGAALGRVGAASTSLAQSIREAVSANDGRGITIELEYAFTDMVTGLNQTWNGQPLFSGERLTGVPVQLYSIAQLQAAGGPEDIYDEAARHQVLDFGDSPALRLAPKASELSQDLFAIVVELQDMIDAAGGSLGQPLTGSQTTQLLHIAGRLDGEANRFISEEGRVGQMQKDFALERLRLQERSDLLTKEVGVHADADLAQVSIQLSTLMVQYEAAAKTFSDLSGMSLLNYL